MQYKATPCFSATRSYGNVDEYMRIVSRRPVFKKPHFLGESLLKSTTVLNDCEPQDVYH